MTQDVSLSRSEIDSLTSYFTYVDADRDGYITADEIQDAAGVDLNGDGVITDDEVLISGQKHFSDLFQYDVNKDQRISLTELIEFYKAQKRNS